MILTRLLESPEPSVRYAARVRVPGEGPASPELRALGEEIRCSPRVAALLSDRDAGGKIPYRPYTKWYGAHWVLATLAGLGYPPGDPALYPLRDQVYDCWLHPQHIKGVPVLDGRARRCASQEGNALYATLVLGIADERADQLAANLLRWQWPDGGWNCDKRPQAINSSFHETLIPLRALARYGSERNCAEATEAAARAAGIFLKRRLFRRQRDGGVIDPHFLLLKYPHYWHYDILAALQVMAETGFINDPRCAEALDRLEAKRLPDGGFPAETQWYHVTQMQPLKGSRLSRVGWGGTSSRHMNEWVTVEALAVLRAAGRLRQDG